MSEKRPLVSVSVVTYNHREYIGQCLDSILSQKVDFDFELLLGEDCSSDGTREICQKYAEKYPDKIRLFLNKREDAIKICGIPTGRTNFINNLQNVRGKYVALMDGDDYWTDFHKLQRQIDFLEAHPTFSMCASNGHYLESDGDIKIIDNSTESKNFTLHQLLTRGWFMPTAGLVYRSEYFPVPEWYKTVLSGDRALIFTVANKGPVHFIHDSMVMYRKHSGGISASRNLSGIFENNAYLFSILKEELAPEYAEKLSRWVLEWKAKSAKQLIREGHTLGGYGKLLTTGFQVRNWLDFKTLVKDYYLKAAV